jgi:hypothetical protein
MLMNSSLERVGAVQFGAVLAREGHAGQYVMLILIYQRGELGPPRAELVDDVSPGSVRCLSFGRQEGLRIAAATIVCWPLGTCASAFLIQCTRHRCQFALRTRVMA